MNLTLKGFLRGYCRELTGLQTDSLRKLLAAVLSDAPAASEAVMAFAAAQGKGSYLARLAMGTRLEPEYRAFCQLCQASGGVEAALQSPEAPQRYRKVWDAFLAQRDAIQADRRVIALMREKTLTALEGSGRTVYGLCAELGLNRGNTYAYLNGGDITKVSRATARRILDAASRQQAAMSSCS
ncbi:MAG: hypothetical protein ACI36V_06560 [Coriobacteriales bacterium]